MSASQEPTYFCDFAVNTDMQLIIDLVLTSLSLPLLFLGIYKFRQMGGLRNRSTNFVYLALLLWEITFVGSNLYASGIYSFYTLSEQKYTNEEMSQYSKYFFMIDWSNTYIMQLLLLYVPYRWCKNITDLFNGGCKNNGSTRGSEIFAITQYTGVQTKIYPFLKIYILIRLLELGLLAAFLPLETQQKLIYQILMYFLLADCLIITISLFFGMISLKTNPDLRESLDQDETRRMFNQYMFISAASLVRFAMNILQIFQLLGGEGPFYSSCPSREEGQEESIFYIVFMFIIAFLGDFFPIFIILRIYTLQEKPEQICNSLIITTTGGHDPSSIHLIRD